ncbi:RusA-like Holliday junction resolvase [Vibrio phage vB_VpS_PG07]|uniref:D14 protein n=1 Tax=Vibrio phage vB_VpS_PG07 TaxID=2301664 RepID=A0A385E6Z6_9CAUD|nr:RusA-like Holliday junction resolvase [Vibrio phage vB_VpS_PG07]AXQ66745.1 D14 protein [Vibrio phage vB_VpS_PG07]
MANSRDKGQRAEYAVRDLLRAATGAQWERVPGSGGFGSQHGLKGDIYLPNSTGLMSLYCIEVKHYADEQFNSNMLKQTKTQSQMEKWLLQTEREAGEMNARPVLVFKKDRGPWFVAIRTKDPLVEKVVSEVPYAIIKVSDDVEEYFVVDFKAFLNNIKLEDLAK